MPRQRGPTKDAADDLTALIGNNHEKYPDMHVVEILWFGFKYSSPRLDILAGMGSGSW